MSEPRPPRQALLVEKGHLGCQQQVVELGDTAPIGVDAVGGTGAGRDPVPEVEQPIDLGVERDGGGTELPIDAGEHVEVGVEVHVALLGLAAQLLDVGVDRLCGCGEIERQNLGVGQTQQKERRNLGQSLAVPEIRVAELRVKPVAVVAAVIDAVARAEPQIHRRDPEVVEEDRVVASRAEGPEAHVKDAVAVMVDAVVVVRPVLENRFLVVGHAHRARHLADERLQRVHAAGIEAAGRV